MVLVRQGVPGRALTWRPGRGGQPHPLPRQGRVGGRATLRQAPHRRGAAPGETPARGSGYHAPAQAIRQRRHAASSRWTSRRARSAPPLRRPARLRHDGEPDRGGRTDPRRRRAGHRWRVLRAHRLRRVRPAADRQLHGLPAADGGGDPIDRNRASGDAVATQSARNQGRRRGRRHPGPALLAEAIDDALAPFGIRVREMPLSPSRLPRS
jgi:hypothetical protein